MAQDFGRGVTRTLNAIAHQFASVVWQKQKPPLDSELNMMAQIEWDRYQNLVRRMMPSGFFLDPTRAVDDFETNALWANLFVLGHPRAPYEPSSDGAEQNPILWANVNGWVIPVSGTNITVDGDTRNWVKLYPPPESDSRVDFVFLEAWQTSVAPNPSTANKPSVSTVYKYGNVQYTGTNLTDDLEDPTIGFETTKRVQVQYRLRVFGQGVGLGSGVQLEVYPDGLDDPNILGQGTSTSPVGGFIFKNMREELGDGGLWRAGDGDATNALGTLDGYVYAIPVAAVFRRNSGTYVAVASSGNPNQNGGFERTPGSKSLANPLEGSRVLLQATLTSDLVWDAGVSSSATISVTDLNGSGWEDTSLTLSSTFMVIGEEILGISAVDSVGGTVTIPVGGRGRWKSTQSGHLAGTAIQFFNSRPDGRYADQISPADVLDMRRGVSAGDWDYTRILANNVASLVRGDLRTAWKQSGAGDSEGPVVHEVDYLYADGSIAVPNHTEGLDGPDGIRTVWSDAAVIQPDVTVLLNNAATQDANGVGLTTADTFDASMRWDVGAGFNPVGFLNLGTLDGGSSCFTNGSSMMFFIGGNNGESGARASFRGSPNPKAVRFVTPREFWKTGYPTIDLQSGNQYPVTLRWLTERAFEPAPSDLSAVEAARHVGPMYPWRNSNFERPFIVLGGLINTALKVTVLSGDLVNGASQFELDVGVNFDASGAFYSQDANGDFEMDPAGVTDPLLRGERTLFDMLTDYGKDRTGSSSEVYVVLYGDDESTQNNGVFRVLGAGTVGYTNVNASSATSIVLEALSADWTVAGGGSGVFDLTTGTPAGTKQITCEFRSQYHNAEDLSDYPARTADLMIVLTDIGGLTETPWKASALGSGETYDLSMPVSGASGRTALFAKLVTSMTLMYHPGRGAQARVPDEIARVALRGGSSTYLQQSPANIDTTFSSVSGMPTNEASFRTVHLQTWNRLPGLGWHAPSAPNYGGNVVGYTEIDRDSQAFIDKGSKTLIFRPFRDREMTLQALSFTKVMGATESLLGNYTWVDLSAKDALNLWTGTTGTGKEMGFPVPREYMPRFGRQDIPYYTDVDAGAGNFLPGINHLFTSKADATEPVFYVIGGRDNTTGGNEVTTLMFVTNEPGTNYGHQGNLGAWVSNLVFIGARKTTDINPASGAAALRIFNDLAAINTSDFGRGLRGIQLPPYYGPARILGVYERANYEAKSGRAYKANRYERDADPATNLLREGADRQTLFILQGGGEDIGGSVDDHTYILPEQAVDISRIPSYVAGISDFPDFEYVVETEVFGFARGFINLNNYVLCRKHNGQGATITDGDNPELSGISMVLPCAAGFNDQLYVAHNRTVYQGDVFMTRAGGTRTVSDYENKYGSLGITDQHHMVTAIQQYDANGNFVPETPNSRPFEVLASLDFYTTLGTGKIGGDLYPGTPLDVGYTQNTPAASARMPDSASHAPWVVHTRAYTEGQKGNTNRAQASLVFLDNSLFSDANSRGSVAGVKITAIDGSVVNLYGIPAANQATFVGATLPGGGTLSADDVFTVDVSLVADVQNRSAPSIYAGVFTPTQGNVAKTWTYTSADPGWEFLEGWTSNDTVHVNNYVLEFSDYGAIFTHAKLGTNQITIVSAYTANPTAFHLLTGGDRNILDVTIDQTAAPIVISAGATQILPQPAGAVTWAAVTTEMAFLVGVDYSSYPALNGLVFTAACNIDGFIEFRAHNYTAGAITLNTAYDVKVVAFADIEPPISWQWEIDADVMDLKLTLIRNTGWMREQFTADNFVSVVNAHAGLTSAITAFNDGTPKVTLEAVPTGTEGNGFRVETFVVPTSVADPGAPPTLPTPEQIFKLGAPRDNTRVGAQITGTYFRGGVDYPVNGGAGSSPLRLTGMTERLPLGALLQDSDFLCENPLKDDASAMSSVPSSIRPIQSLLPLIEGGEEYTRFLGVPGELVAMADGQATPSGYTAWTTSTPTGSRRFRLYRGGGSAFMLSGENPGGPLDWVSQTFPSSSQPVLKGGVLACKALLVRNYYEEAFAAPYKTTDGDEIQMMVITYGILGGGNTVQEGITLNGIISPAGYGEGYAAADRYRCQGRPMMKAVSRNVPNPDAVTLAVYPETERTALATELAQRELEDKQRG